MCFTYLIVEVFLKDLQNFLERYPWNNAKKLVSIAFIGKKANSKKAYIHGDLNAKTFPKKLQKG